MNKVTVAVVLAVLIGAGAWLAISNDNSNSSNMDMNNTSEAQTQQKAQPVSTDKVSLQSMAFTPANITVKAGTTVTWTNDDNVAHTVTENDSQEGPNSSELAPGKTYSFTFTKAGVYNYHCTLHSQMTGIVTVTE